MSKNVTIYLLRLIDIDVYNAITAGTPLAVTAVGMSCGRPQEQEDKLLHHGNLDFKLVRWSFESNLRLLVK